MSAARLAAEHLATLNTFASLVAVLEGGTVYDPKASATADRIIRLCHAEQQRQLKRYDAALAKTKATP